MSPRSLFLIVPLLIIHHALAATPTAEAEARLHTAVDSAVKIAGSASSPSVLAEKLQPVLRKYLSFDAMTRRAIGPGWRQFSKDQQDDAIRLFTTLIVRTYSSKYTPGEQPKVTYRPATMPAPGRVEVPTTVIYKGSRYAVTYRLEEAEGWRITDVVIEGVSLVANYRSQFDSEFKKGGAVGVINALNRSVGTSK